MSLRYISQKHSQYADCVPIAICNALRFLGLRTPRPGTQRWEAVVDAAGCRHGGTYEEHGVAKFLGAKLVRVARKNISKHVPALVLVQNPEVGHHLHAVTIIAADATQCTAVNYRVEGGPLVEQLPWGKEPPRRHSEKTRVERGRYRDGSTRYITVDLGPFDRGIRWPEIYPVRQTYAVVPSTRQEAT